MNIDFYLQEDIKNPKHPSIFNSADEYSVLILRLPKVVKKDILITSYAFLIKENNSYLYDRDKNEFKNIGTLKDIQDFLDKKIDVILKDIQRYHYKIDKMEDLLYEKLPKNFLNNWLEYKKVGSLFQRLMFHANIAIEMFINKYKKHKDFEKFAYADIADNIKRIYHLSKAMIEKLDYLYDFYKSKVDEKMNKNVYYLTIISGIFLPLTLMTGFFGMNTGGLPYTNDPNGTIKVVFISLFLEIVFLVPFIILNKIKK